MIALYNRLGDLFSNHKETNMADTNQESRQCTNCGRNKDTIACSICAYMPAAVDLEHPAPRYCSRKCRRKHANSHKSQCSHRLARRAFLRAADLLLTIYILYLEATNGQKIKGDIIVEDGKITFGVDWDQMDKAVAPFALPEGLNQDGLQHEKASVLAFLTCNYSLTSMYRLVSWLLTGRMLISTVLS